MHSAEISLVAAQVEDFETLVSLRIEAMRPSLERIGRFDPIRARERFLGGFAPEHTRHIVFGQDRVGFVVVKPQGNHLLLDHLYIAPKYQRKGIGAVVLGKILAEATSLSCPVRVGALRESDSNKFYVRHGFQLIESAEFDNYYLWPNKNAL